MAKNVVNKITYVLMVKLNGGRYLLHPHQRLSGVRSITLLDRFTTGDTELDLLALPLDYTLQAQEYLQ